MRGRWRVGRPPIPRPAKGLRPEEPALPLCCVSSWRDSFAGGPRRQWPARHRRPLRLELVLVLVPCPSCSKLSASTRMRASMRTNRARVLLRPCPGKEFPCRERVRRPSSRIDPLNSVGTRSTASPSSELQLGTQWKASRPARTVGFMDRRQRRIYAAGRHCGCMDALRFTLHVLHPGPGVKRRWRKFTRTQARRGNFGAGWRRPSCPPFLCAGPVALCPE